MVSTYDLVIKYRRNKVLEFFLLEPLTAIIGRTYLERLYVLGIGLIGKVRKANGAAILIGSASRAGNVKVRNDKVERLDVVAAKRIVAVLEGLNAVTNVGEHLVKRRARSSWSSIISIRRCISPKMKTIKKCLGCK